MPTRSPMRNWTEARELSQSQPGGGAASSERGWGPTARPPRGSHWLRGVCQVGSASLSLETQDGS